MRTLLTGVVHAVRPAQGTFRIPLVLALAAAVLAIVTVG